MKFAYVTVGGLGQHAKPTPTSEFEVHAEGCAHIKRRLADGADSFLYEADTPEELVAEEVAYYTDNGQGWTEDDFRIFPCAKAAR